jgi:glycosyltransferase involved in cell wall biosynthesis
MAPPLTGSVIVRSKDRAHVIERALQALRDQTTRPEIIVVDSGSTDGTVEIARRLADRVIEIPPETFSFGGALNTGARAANGEIHFALSSHCAPADDAWIERSLSLYGRADAAGTNGAMAAPGRGLLQGPVFLGYQDHLVNPFWGFSNHASSWRGEAWREHQFDETLVASEDKEWALRVTRAGWTIGYDPALLVTSFHRQQEGARALYDRAAREASALVQAAGLPMQTPGVLARRWWGEFDEVDPRLRRRVRLRADLLRAVELFGQFRGTRRAGRLPGRR